MKVLLDDTVQVINLSSIATKNEVKVKASGTCKFIPFKLRGKDQDIEQIIFRNALENIETNGADQAKMEINLMNIGDTNKFRRGEIVKCLDPSDEEIGYLKIMEVPWGDGYIVVTYANHKNTFSLGAVAFIVLEEDSDLTTEVINTSVYNKLIVKGVGTVDVIPLLGKSKGSATAEEAGGGADTFYGLVDTPANGFGASYAAPILRSTSGGSGTEWTNLLATEVDYTERLIGVINIDRGVHLLETDDTSQSSYTLPYIFDNMFDVYGALHFFQNRNPFAFNSKIVCDPADNFLEGGVLKTELEVNNGETLLIQASDDDPPYWRVLGRIPITGVVPAASEFDIVASESVTQKGMYFLDGTLDLTILNDLTFAKFKIKQIAGVGTIKSDDSEIDGIGQTITLNKNDSVEIARKSNGKLYILNRY